MEQIPPFWRTEVWHPLSVHFPIVLLVVATLAYIVSLFLKRERQDFWYQMAKILLIGGVAAAWIGIYTGDMADGIVSRKICDPTVLKDHENSAYTSSIIFSIALGLQIVLDLKWWEKLKKIGKLAVVVLLVVGSGYLMYAGHLGATVVYQQGGGVYHPSGDCREFE
ncbi:DUF2231 domain-containing protein [Nafulsella turpanensis]|uniref:DUF2231 domain-containing protein n=1 Tax=Nafulsella turpanensis TaxID=1265690 RepID=UPI00034A6DC7|nr:DUF2231 domain-containing protein [Nafulsella turpanensis]